MSRLGLPSNAAVTPNTTATPTSADTTPNPYSGGSTSVESLPPLSQGDWSTGGRGGEYEYSPTIEAAFEGADWLKGTAESLRKDYNFSMGAGGATEFQSHLANAIRARYGEEKFQNLNDVKVLQLYIQSDKNLAGLPQEEVLSRMTRKFLPNYHRKESNIPAPVNWAKEQGQMLARDTIGALTVGAYSAVKAIAARSEVERLTKEMQELASTGVGADAPEMVELQKRLKKETAALHGATQVLGPSVAMTLVNALTMGKGGIVGSLTKDEAKRLFWTETVTGHGFGEALSHGTLNWLATSTGLKSGAFSPLLKGVARWGLIPAAKGAGGFMEWEALKHLTQMGPWAPASGEVAKDIIPSMVGAIQSGAIFGVGGHAFGRGLKAVKLNWAEMFPNIAHTSLRDSGAPILDKIKLDPAKAVNTLGINLEADMAQEGARILRTLYGEQSGLETTNAGKKFIEDFSKIMGEFRKNNPDFIPDWGVDSAAGESSGPRPGPKRITPDSPNSDMKKMTVLPNGRSVNIESLSEKELIAEYRRLPEGVDDALKEGMWREFKRRWPGGLPQHLKEQLPRPSWHPEVPGETPVAQKLLGEDLPEGWGSSENDRFLDLDIPYEEAERTRRVWRQSDRYHMPISDGPLYPPRVETLRDRFAMLVDMLHRQIISDRALPEPPQPRPHPGWTRSLDITGVDAVERMQRMVDDFNAHFGDESAQMAFDVPGQRATLLLNRDLAGYLAQPKLGGYVPFNVAVQTLNRMTEADAIQSIRQSLHALGFPEQGRFAVAAPNGRIYLASSEEYARELFEAGKHDLPKLTQAEIEANRTSWMRARDAVLAYTENAQRSAAPPPPTIVPTAAAMAEPFANFFREVGVPKLDSKGVERPHIRIVADKQISIRPNEAADALDIGTVGQKIPDAQMRYLVEMADTHQVPIEHRVNVSSAIKSKLELLKSLGFKQVGKRQGATVFRREPILPGNITAGEAKILSQNNPVIEERATGKPKEMAELAAGNVTPGQPAIKPAIAPRQFDPTTD